MGKAVDILWMDRHKYEFEENFVNKKGKNIFDKK